MACLQGYQQQEVRVSQPIASQIPLPGFMSNKARESSNRMPHRSEPNDYAYKCNEDYYVVEEAMCKDALPKTTVFVQNLPCKIGHQRMMLELKALGLDGCYDFINFPARYKRGKNSCFNYGFINFLSHDFAVEFMTKFANHRFDDLASEKQVRVDWTCVRDQSDYLAAVRKAARKKHRSCMYDPAGLKAPDTHIDEVMEVYYL